MKHFQTETLSSTYNDHSYGISVGTYALWTITFHLCLWPPPYYSNVFCLQVYSTYVAALRVRSWILAYFNHYMLLACVPWNIPSFLRFFALRIGIKRYDSFTHIAQCKMRMTRQI